MGVEDRDWYREKPSHAGEGVWTQHRSGRQNWGRLSLHPGAGLAIVASVVASAVIWQFDLLQIRVPDPATSVAVAPAPSPRSSNEIRLTPTPRLGMRVARDTRWTVSDPRFGTLSVVVPAGKSPLSVIARELDARGYQVTLPAPLGRG